MPTFIVPNSFGTLREFNPCHSTQDGKFCSTPGTGRRGGGTYKSAGERDAAEGRVSRAKPEEFKAALAKNTRADTLSDYDAETLSTFRLYLLKGGQAGYALKPDGEFVNLFNSGGDATKGAGPWLVLHAIEQGATHGDHFDGFLTGFYKKLGWKETKREANWTPGGPDVVFMEWKGGDRHTARARYRRDGSLDAG